MSLTLSCITRKFRRNIFVLITLLLVVSCTKSVEEKRLINSDKFNQIISEKDKTLVYIWTTWCSGCRNSLQHTLPKLINSLNDKEYQLLLIAVSKNVAEVDSLVHLSGLSSSNIYFLDFIGPDKGKFQSLGIRQFLTANFPDNKIYNGGIPVFFLVDSNGHVLIKKMPKSYYNIMDVLE